MGLCGRRFRLEVPNDPATIPLIRNFVRTVANITGFDRTKASEIELAVEQASKNVVQHALPPSEKASFDVICEAVPLGLKITIKEMGPPFDLSRLPECSPGDSAEDNSVRTHGICLMKKAMDEVSFRNLGKSGKETHLLKYLDSQAIGSCMTAEDLEDAEKTEAVETLPYGSVTYQVRRMNPSEAAEISKCAYAAYHYSYFYEFMYYPERIRSLNETGDLISYVAVTTDNEIIGHAAIKGDGERGAAELMAAFVKPKFRGQGCLNALTEALIEEGRKRSFAGLYVRAVTSHPYSQKTALKYGFKGCCLFLAQHDPLEFMEIHTGKRERESMLYAFAYLSAPDRFRIFSPPHHTEMVLRMYDELGARPEPVFVQMELPEDKCSVSVTIEQYDAARIEVLRYGNDVISEVKRNLRALCVERIEAIYLFLNLCDPLTAVMTSEFEKMGFFFAGINPGSAGSDLIVLQFLNNIVIDYGRLKFASDMGRQIAEYIRLCDPNLVL